MDHLLFQLYGPLAAWGETAIGETRPSASYPSKSAIVGLLGAALGIARDEDEAHRKLAHDLGFAVQVRQAGALLRDYHTTQVPPTRRKIRHATRKDELQAGKLATILSTRDYRCDAWSVVALWQLDAGRDLLDRLRAALQRPVYPLYLGRKACPLALPLEPQTVTVDTLAGAFEGVSFASDGDETMQVLRSSSSDIHWDAHPRHGFSQVLQRTRRKDRIVSRQRWQFADREEFMTRWSPSCT